MMICKSGDNVNLSNRTSEALDILVGQFFNLNRTFDRAVSWMEVKFAMPNAANIIHHKLAHLWPLMADIISDFKHQWNVVTYYPETHGDGREYDNLEEMMGTLLRETVDVYEVIKQAYYIAKEEQDFNANAMLQKLMQDMNAVIAQVIILHDKSEQMSTDYDNFDRHIDSWGIDGLAL